MDPDAVVFTTTPSLATITESSFFSSCPNRKVRAFRRHSATESYTEFHFSTVRVGKVTIFNSTFLKPGGTSGSRSESKRERGRQSKREKERERERGGERGHYSDCNK